MNLGPHADFIMLAYAAAIAIVAALVAWVLVDRWRLDQMLGEMETRGVTRRSEEKR